MESQVCCFGNKADMSVLMLSCQYDHEPSLSYAYTERLCNWSFRMVHNCQNLICEVCTAVSSSQTTSCCFLFERREHHLSDESRMSRHSKCESVRSPAKSVDLAITASLTVASSSASQAGLLGAVPLGRSPFVTVCPQPLFRSSASAGTPVEQGC